MTSAPWTLDRLVEKLRLPVDPIDDVVTLLERNGLIIETADNPPAYVPARVLETISLSDMLDAVRIAEDDAVSLETRVLALPVVDDVLRAMEKSMKESLGDMTIRDLVGSR